MRIEVANVETIAATFAALGFKLQGAATVAANREARYIFPKTQRRVPWRSGQLWASGRVDNEEVETNGDVITTGIAYGGPAGAGRNTEDVDYALIVHEDLEASHWFGRSAKYVETPVREELESGRSAQRMGQTIIEYMGW